MATGLPNTGCASHATRNGCRTASFFLLLLFVVLYVPRRNIKDDLHYRSIIWLVWLLLGAFYRLSHLPALALAPTAQTIQESILEVDSF